MIASGTEPVLLTSSAQLRRFVRVGDEFVVATTSALVNPLMPSTADPVWSAVDREVQRHVQRCLDEVDLVVRRMGDPPADRRAIGAHDVIDLTIQPPPDELADMLARLPVVSDARPDLRTNRPFTQPIQSERLAARRPTSPAFASAAIAPHELDPGIGFGAWLDAHPIDAAVREKLKSDAASFAWQPTISVVMPVYDTPVDILRSSVASVVDQIYSRWELCICDDASPNADTQAALAEIAASDKRIRVTRRIQNGRIAAASNDALAMATGEFVGLLDHDDLLSPDALVEVVRFLNERPDLDFMYSDEVIVDRDGTALSAFLKPAFSRRLLECVNYVTHFAVYRRSMLTQVGGFRSGFDGSQDYDLALRVTEQTRAVGHLAKPVYSWRQIEGSVADAPDAKPYAFVAARKALAEALMRQGIDGEIVDGRVPYTYRTRRAVKGSPRVSIVIPTRNGFPLLARCLSSVDRLSTYDHYEFVIVDNQTDDPDALALFARAGAHVVRYPYPFNYARQMNFGVEQSHGDLVLLLNNDTYVVEPEWIEAMIEHAQDERVGAVGARTVFPSGSPQHEGVAVRFGPAGIGNVVWHGYYGLGEHVRDVTAVTAACMMMRPDVFWQVGGFDERLRVAYNDVDLCLKIRSAGYDIVYTPYAELGHDESASRGSLHPDEDVAMFAELWGDPTQLTDPFYNPNFAMEPMIRLRRGDEP
jgi:O-antigen biosynthesis protein